MTMTAASAAKVAAKRLGISVTEYQDRRAAGKKWCYACKDWYPLTEFHVDRARKDGRHNRCRNCVQVQNLSYNASLRAATRHRYFWTGGRPAHSQYEDIWRLQRQGMTLPEIARELDCSYWSVRRTVKRALHPEQYRQELIEKLARLKTPELVPLDAPLSTGGESLGSYYIGVSTDDEIQRDAAERLRAIVGDMDPEDVRLLDSATLARLQDRLRDEGLVPRGVQQIERDRLRNPVRHTGAGVQGAPLIPGRKKRAQKIAHKEANRARGNSNRPSQKPRKRWSRDEEFTA